jgi:hypothetical protein
MQHQERQHAVECVVAVGHGAGVAGLECDPRLPLLVRIPAFGEVDVGLREIDAGDRALWRAGGQREGEAPVPQPTSSTFSSLAWPAKSRNCSASRRLQRPMDNS